MKIHSVLTRLAALAFAAFLASVALNAAALLSFILATIAFLSLIAAHDYAQPARPRLAVAATALRFPARSFQTEERRLAA